MGWEGTASGRKALTLPVTGFERCRSLESDFSTKCACLHSRTWWAPAFTQEETAHHMQQYSEQGGKQLGMCYAQS